MGRGGEGVKGQGASGVGVGFPPGAACSEPTRTESLDRDYPSRPRERARLAQPCLSELEAGRMGGAGPVGGAKVARVPIGGRRQAGTGEPHWAGHWLRVSRPKSAIGCGGLSRGGYWVRGQGRCPPGPGCREWYLPPPST